MTQHPTKPTDKYNPTGYTDAPKGAPSPTSLRRPTPKHPASCATVPCCSAPVCGADPLRGARRCPHRQVQPDSVHISTQGISSLTTLGAPQYPVGLYLPVRCERPRRQIQPYSVHRHPQVRSTSPTTVRLRAQQCSVGCCSLCCACPNTS